MTIPELHLILLGLTVAAGLAAALHILLTMRDDTQRAALWLLLVVTFPVFGSLLYVVAGVSRRNTFGKKIARSVAAFLLQRDQAEHLALKSYKDQMSRFIGKDPGSPVHTMDFIVMLERLLKSGSAFPSEEQNDFVYPVLPLGATSLSGNKIELFCDGTDAYPAMLDSIRSARKNIHLQSFIFADDRIGRTIMAALCERAEAGVEVRILFDKFGSFKSSWFLLDYRSRSLPNLQIRPFSHASLLTPWRIQLRNHRKLLVVDGHTAFTGGLNISQENIRTKDHLGIHDFHCRVRGPVVSELQFLFFCDWLYASRRHPETLFLREYFPHPEACGNDIVRLIASGHGYFFEGTEKVFFAAASTARKSLWIITPYFAPPQDFCKALRMASARGVDVRLIVPAVNNHWFMKMASGGLYETLCSDGVRIFERQEVFTHAKAMLVDGQIAYLGSSNCDVRSFRLNFELDMLVEQGDFPEILHRQFLSELKNSVEITGEKLRNKTIFRKLGESLCALLTPVL